MLRKIVFALCSFLACVGALFMAAGFALISLAGGLAMKMED
jgi:hypothetical protein